MATKALNFKMEENEIMDMKQVAAVYHLTLTEMIKDALREYVQRLKEDPFYRLTVNVEDADAEETSEVLDAIEGMTDDDLAISSVKRFAV